MGGLFSSSSLSFVFLPLFWFFPPLLNFSFILCYVFLFLFPNVSCLINSYLIFSIKIISFILSCTHFFFLVLDFSFSWFLVT
jgi:hypothetical protein